jgi:hypothetical protein
MKQKLMIGLALTVALALIVNPAAAKDKNKVIESFKANAIAQTQGAGSMAEINIYRWTTDEERGEILEAIKKATADPRTNSREIAKALRGQAKAGYAFMGANQGYPLRYAKSFDLGGGKRQIILATDRPVSFGEVYQQTQLGDFDVTLVILNLDENGKGEGILSLGTEVRWNDKEGKIELTNVSSQPIKLGDVRPAK